jgi:hypothetical protein
LPGRVPGFHGLSQAWPSKAPVSAQGRGALAKREGAGREAGEGRAPFGREREGRVKAGPALGQISFERKILEGPRFEALSLLS